TAAGTRSKSAATATATGAPADAKKSTETPQVDRPLDGLVEIALVYLDALQRAARLVVACVVALVLGALQPSALAVEQLRLRWRRAARHQRPIGLVQLPVPGVMLGAHALAHRQRGAASLVHAVVVGLRIVALGAGCGVGGDRQNEQRSHAERFPEHWDPLASI